MPENELKPCPSCKSRNPDVGYIGQPAQKVYLACRCGWMVTEEVIQLTASGSDVDFDGTLELAYKLWNTRVQVDVDGIMEKVHNAYSGCLIRIDDIREILTDCLEGK